MAYFRSIAYVIFAALLIWYSYQVWLNPKAFLKWTKAYRSKFYGGPFGALLKRMYGHSLDSDPMLELWWARIGLLFLYGLVIYVIGIAVGRIR